MVIAYTTASPLINYQTSRKNQSQKPDCINTNRTLPFKNMVANYVKESGNHVLYRVTPVFGQDNLVVSGVQIEAKSMEDNGEGVLFNVFCYNVQPGIIIDYATGDSAADGSISTSLESTPMPIQAPAEATISPPTPIPAGASYAVNANNGKIHIVGGCSATKGGKNAMKNPVYFGTYEEAEGYSSSIAPSLDKRKCGNCW